MGYDVERFVNFDQETNRELICVICRGILEDPKVTECEHAFCSTCINQWLSTHSQNATTLTAPCPLCTEIIDDDLNGAPRLLRNMLNSLKIKCDYETRGCNTTVRLDALNAHLSECKYRKFYERIDFIGLAVQALRILYPIVLIISLVIGYRYRNDCHSLPWIPNLLTIIAGTGLIQLIIERLREMDHFADRNCGIVHILYIIRLISLQFLIRFLYFKMESVQQSVLYNNTFTQCLVSNTVSNVDCNAFVIWTSKCLITTTIFYEICYRYKQIYETTKKCIINTIKYLF